MNIAAIGDLHCESGPRGPIRELLKDAALGADVLLLAGDLTNRGRIEEMEALLAQLRPLSTPVVAVLGNHDHEQGNAGLLVKMLEADGVCVLEGTGCVIGGVGFVGTKGFCGGFGDNRVQPFGETEIKDFVNSGVREVLRLENALAALDTRRKVGLMHYAPIKETLLGEPAELYPFMGTSLAGDALDRAAVDVVFHGHAHQGALHGRTAGGIPVHNVSRFARTRMEKPAFLALALDERG